MGRTCGLPLWASGPIAELHGAHAFDCFSLGVMILHFLVGKTRSAWRRPMLLQVGLGYLSATPGTPIFRWRSHKHHNGMIMHVKGHLQFFASNHNAPMKTYFLTPHKTTYSKFGVRCISPQNRVIPRTERQSKKERNEKIR